MREKFRNKISEKIYWKLKEGKARFVSSVYTLKQNAKREPQ
jgi:hypothetical protein